MHTHNHMHINTHTNTHTYTHTFNSRFSKGRKACCICLPEADSLHYSSVLFAVNVTISFFFMAKKAFHCGHALLFLSPFIYW